MKVYKNTATGVVIHTYGTVGGGNWEEVKPAEKVKEPKKKKEK